MLSNLDMLSCRLWIKITLLYFSSKHSVTNKVHRVCVVLPGRKRNTELIKELDLSDVVLGGGKCGRAVGIWRGSYNL